MSELNQQPGLFDDIDDIFSNEESVHEQNLSTTTLVHEVPLLEYLLSENRVRVVDIKLAKLLCADSNCSNSFSGLPSPTLGWFCK